MNEPIQINSWGLLSKWGFCDGEILNEFIWDNGLDFGRREDFLRLVIERKLLPELAKNHVIETYHIDTNHNPIRAEVVDGIQIDDYAGLDQVALTPASITITHAELMAIYEELPK